MGMQAARGGSATRVLCATSPPGQGAWMKHGAPWFAILQRQRWRLADYASTTALRAKIAPWLVAWKAGAPPGN